MMKKVTILSLILFCGLFAKLANAGGTAYIPHWEQNSSWQYWIFFSNIGNEDIKVRLNFRDNNGNIVNPINMSCHPSCSANQYFTLDAKGSGKIYIPNTPQATYGYVTIEYDVIDQQGNVIDGISKLIVHAHRQSLSAQMTYTVPVNSGMPF